MIDLKAYRSVSSEIFHNIEINGERFTKMLSAVALLGQDTPGVMNLDDILSMYGFEVQKFNNNKGNSVIITFTEDKMPNKTSLEEKLEKENADLQKKVENYSKQEKVIDAWRKHEAFKVFIYILQWIAVAIFKMT